MAKAADKDPHKLLAHFLETYPLYKKLSIQFNSPAPGLGLPLGLQGLTFSAHCPIDDGQQTFRMIAEPSQVITIAFQALKKDENALRALYPLFRDGDHQYDYTIYYSATCQRCGKFQRHFLLNIYSDEEGNIHYLKVGQQPPYEIAPDPQLIKYLQDEDKTNYKKALICKSQHYGMGSYAYLRRIIQNEILRIVTDISKIDSPESTEIKKLIANYEADHQMEKLISAIGDYLPSSFGAVGGNPIKFLYQQLSRGIHEYTEDECADIADQIDTVLKFVIERINEENSTLRKVREALKYGPAPRGSK
jgi:hypothetical protein